MLIVGAANAKTAGAQPGRTLIYGCGVAIPNASWSARCGVSWKEAVAKDWLLKDANGKYVPYGHGYSYLYLADIGNSSYEQRYISEMDSEIRAYRGVDGVFIDNVVGNLINTSDRFRDNASYRQAMLAFIDGWPSAEGQRLVRGSQCWDERRRRARARGRAKRRDAIHLVVQADRALCQRNQH